MTSWSRLSPRSWPKRVVDVFEAVEVEQEDAEHLLIAARREQRLAQAVAEQAAVWQPGQRVVQRLVFQRVGLGLALRDVAKGRDEQVPRAPICIELTTNSSGNRLPFFRLPMVSCAPLTGMSSVSRRWR